MKIKHFLLIVVLLCSVSCGSSETLIVGQLAEYDEEAIDSDSFKGQTIYVYRESEIKAFLENKNLAVTDVISQLNKILNKCDELEKKIPTFNSLEIEKYDQAKKTCLGMLKRIRIETK